jgi:hypothetical protein
MLLGVAGLHADIAPAFGWSTDVRSRRITRTGLTRK